MSLLLFLLMSLSISLALWLTACLTVCLPLSGCLYIYIYIYLLDLANNKLKSIAGLRSLVHLKKIDLGANRIREMDENELSGLVHLEELWIGKNKIEQIRGLETVRSVWIFLGSSEQST